MLCINNLRMNHVMYADDICLMAPSPEALQELIDTCYDFRVQNDVFKFFQIVFRGQASHWPGGPPKLFCGWPGWPAIILYKC